MLKIGATKREGIIDRVGAEKKNDGEAFWVFVCAAKNINVARS